jgi:hypothetical protein
MRSTTRRVQAFVDATGLLLALLVAAGCGGTGNPADAATEAGTLDAATDAGTLDAIDAQPAPDSGPPTRDAAPMDTGVVDAGRADTGTPDTRPATDAGSSVPTAPITFPRNMPFTITVSGITSYVYVPGSYDGTHRTPIRLLTWLHGCGGNSAGDIYTASPGGSAQTWISLAVGGREGDCWHVDTDTNTVLNAIAALKTHFNIMPRGVVLGGYSSGGDLSYRIMFYHAEQFAGVLAENTSPYRDTGSTRSASLAAAAWRFNVAHLAHLQDTTYPIAGVRTETDSMTAAGFPMHRIEVDGTHYDAPGATVAGHMVPGTSADIATYLFPYMGMGWLAP